MKRIYLKQILNYKLYTTQTFEHKISYNQIRIGLKIKVTPAKLSMHSWCNQNSNIEFLDL